MRHSSPDIRGGCGGDGGLRPGGGYDITDAAHALIGVRLGLLGGTFDPPHLGHVLVASDAYEALRLDRLLFVPAGTQPLKSDSVHATPRQRLEMLTLALAADTRFAVDPIEIERGGLSFTVETLESIAERYSRERRYLLIGEDLVGQFSSWREPRRIASLADIVVLTRSSAPETGTTVTEKSMTDIPMSRLPTRRVDVSSTEIRARVRAGLSIRGFVAERVEEYIRDSGLYR